MQSLNFNSTPDTAQNYKLPFLALITDAQIGYTGGVWEGVVMYSWVEQEIYQVGNRNATPARSGSYVASGDIAIQPAIQPNNYYIEPGSYCYIKPKGYANDQFVYEVVDSTPDTFVYVTDNTPNVDGWCQGKVQVWNQTTGLWFEPLRWDVATQTWVAATCYIRDANNAGLNTGNIYAVTYSGLYSQLPAYITSSSAGNTSHILVTSEEVDGVYQCLPASYDTATDSWIYGNVSYVFQPNGTPLIAGDYYLAVLYGESEGFPLYATTEGCCSDSSSGADFDYLDYEVTMGWVDKYGALFTGVEMYLPEKGTYMIYKQPFWQVINNTSTGNRLDAVQSWLCDDVKGGTDITYGSPGTIQMTFCYDADTNYYPTYGVTVEAFGKTPVTCLYYTDQPTTVKLIQYHSGGGGGGSDVHTVYLLFAYMWWVKLSSGYLPGTTINGSTIIVT